MTIGRQSVSNDLVIVYGLRRLARKGYIYVGSTVQPLEVRLRRHLMDAKNKRHTNKKLAHIIRQSQFLIVADILEICSLEERAQVEYSQIVMLHELGHELANQTNPVNPRQRLFFVV